MFYSINIDFFVYLIVFSSIMLFMLLILIYIRIYKRIAAKREKLNHDRFLKFLKIVISTIDNMEYDEYWHLESKLILDRFKKYYTNRRTNRDFIAREILKLHRMLKGTPAKRLEDIYYYMELDKSGMKYLKKRNSTFHSEIIRDFDQMNVTWAVPEIRKHLNNFDPTVRAEAIIALFHLDNNSIISDASLIGDLSLWHKLKILETIKLNTVQDTTTLNSALNSNNTLLVELALAVINHNNLDFDKNSILKLLSTKNYQYVKQSVPIIIRTNDEKLIDKLFEIFGDIEDEDLKIHVLKEIKALNSQSLVPYLMDLVYNQIYSDTVRLEALRSAYIIANNCNISLSLNETDTDYNKLIKMFDHAQDQYI